MVNEVLSTCLLAMQRTQRSWICPDHKYEHVIRWHHYIIIFVFTAFCAAAIMLTNELELID